MFAARRRERFVGMASVPMQAPHLACIELERAARLGLKGVMIPPSVQGQALDEPQFEPFWDAAETLQMPVFIHPFEAAPNGVLARYNLGNPVGGPAHPVAEVTSLGLTPEDEAAILRENAATMLDWA